MITKWITQKEASEITGKTLKSINELIRNKRLNVCQKFGKKLVSRDEVLNFKPKRPGRPKIVIKGIEK